jgi:hypothetical protein
LACKFRGAFAMNSPLRHRGRRVFLTVFAVFGLFPLLLTAQTRQRVSFNADWRFEKNDPSGLGNRLAYDQVKDWVKATGNEFVVTGPKAAAAAKFSVEVPYVNPAFDDTGWRRLDLPHDWAIEGPFSQDLSGHTKLFKS